MSDSYQKLAALAELRWERSRVELAPLLQKERQMRAALDELRRSPAESDLARAGYLGTRAGFLQAWEKWTSQRQQELNQKLALVLADKEELREKAKTEFGRREVIRLISAQATQK